MTASRQPFGIEIGLAPELCDPLGGNIRMTLLFFGVLEEFLCHCLCVNASGHVIVAFISKHADDFGSQDFVQNADDRLPVGAVGTRDCTLVHMLTGASAELLNI